LLHDKWKINLSENKYFIVFAKYFWGINILLIVILFFNPADSQVGLYQKIYNHYPEPITLYYLKNNPYNRAKDIHYYKRENLIIKKAESPNQPEAFAPHKYLVAVRGKDPEHLMFKEYKLVYTSYPEWIKIFNINHWMDRTNVWYVYEVVK
jgi:GPI mannosyltransferase 3